MFERFLHFANDFITTIFDFSVEVIDFMTYEIDLFENTYSVFELMFSGAVGVYLALVLIKAVA